MNDQRRVQAFIEMAPFMFLMHQIEFYTERLKEVRSESEFVFLKTTLLQLKKSLPKFLN